jgi:hypothetical protein
MGRAMLIIVGGLLLSIGITKQGQLGTIFQMTNHSTKYAEVIQANNIANSAIELAVHGLMQNSDWRTGTTPWSVDLDEGHAEVYITDVPAEDLIRVRSTGFVNGERRTVTVLFDHKDIHFVPLFDAAISIKTNLFDFHVNGEATEIDGTSPEEGCDPVPGVMVTDNDSYDKVDEYESVIYGDPQIGVDEDGSFDEANKLISMLEHAPGTQYLPSGNYNGGLGTADNPGVYFVENQTTISGNTEGYGILVVRRGAEILVEGEDEVIEGEDGQLSVRGTFEFTGLVIFENAFNLEASGTPTINGSVFIGASDTWEDNIDILIQGTPKFKYSCAAQLYAQQAAAQVIEYGKQYIPLSVYEEMN